LPPLPDTAAEINAALEREAPALFRALSPLGRRAGVPVRTAASPASIAAPPPALAAALSGLSSADLRLAAEASPAGGLPETRRRWRDWQRRQISPDQLSTLPWTTAGLAHGLALAADLFGGPGRAVAVPEPFWGNYRQTFAVRTGARILTAPAYRGGRFHPRACAEALAALPPGEPAVAILNLPSNPGGYSPTVLERRQLRESLVGEAGRRPLVVLCDDAYAGLVFEDVPRRSMFWELAGAHPDLVPVKIDGGTKEFSFFGGRVGFLTFALPPDSAAAGALERKLAALVRATVGSPPSASQVILLQALRDPGIADQVEAVRALLEGRYRALRGAFDRTGVGEGLFRVLPFNAGCFALVEVDPALGIPPNEVRRHLLARQDTGLISIEPRYLRIAHCSVDAAALPELASRLERGIAELAALAAPASHGAVASASDCPQGD